MDILKQNLPQLNLYAIQCNKRLSVHNFGVLSILTVILTSVHKVDMLRILTVMLTKISRRHFQSITTVSHLETLALL
jgi:hypothetical protein